MFHLTVDGETITLFRRILGSYIVIVMLGVVLSVSVHLTAFRIAAEQARANQLKALQHSGRTMDLYLDELDSIARRISTSRRFRALLGVSASDRSARPMRSYEMWDELRFDLIDSEVVEDAYLIVPHLDVVLSRDRILLEPERHYAELFGSYAMNYEQWKQLSSGWGPRRHVLPIATWVSETGATQAIGYGRSFPLDHSHLTTATVLFLISDETVHSTFRQHATGSSTVAMIASDGRTVAGMGDRQVLDHVPELALEELFMRNAGSFARRVGRINSFVTFDVSSRGDLLYVSVLPVSDVFASIRPVRYVAIGLILAYLTTGIAVGFMLARMNTKPYSKLIAANARLESVVHETKPYIQASVLTRLLRGEFEVLEELDPTLTELRFPDSEIGYRVVVAAVAARGRELSGHGAQSDRFHRSRLMLLLQENATDQDLVFSLGDSDVYLLHALSVQPEQDEHQMRELVRSIRSRTAGLQTSIAVGEVVDSLLALKHSADSAYEIADYAELSGADEISFRSDLPPSKDETYYYPNDLQLRIERAVQAGDTGRLKAGLDQIWQANFSSNQTGPHMIRQLLYDLRGSYLRAVNGRVHPESLLWLRERCLDFFAPEYDAKPPEFEALSQALIDAASAIQAERRPHCEVLRDQIIRFVNRNMTNPSLCVALVASEHELTDGYFSKFFHDQVGETFSHYVESGRLELAERLLRSSSEDLKAVAIQCGFGSLRTFRRAFKRRFGIAPSQARLEDAAGP